MPLVFVFHAVDGSVQKDAWSCHTQSDISSSTGLELRVATQNRQTRS